MVISKIIVMTNATERKILRWVHIIASIPIIGYIYGPVAERPEAVIVVRFILFPAVVLTGLWMWKGLWLRNWWKKKRVSLFPWNLEK